MYGIIPINGKSRVYNGQIVRMAQHADPRITGECRSSLARVQNTTEIAMQRHKIMSEAEREEIARIMRKYLM